MFISPDFRYLSKQDVKVCSKTKWVKDVPSERLSKHGWLFPGISVLENVVKRLVVDRP